MFGHCDLTVYLTVRDSGEPTVSIALAHTFTGHLPAVFVDWQDKKEVVHYAIWNITMCTNTLAITTRMHSLAIKSRSL